VLLVSNTFYVFPNIECIFVRNFLVWEIYLCFFFLLSEFFYPLLARLDIAGAGVEQSFDCLIVQNRQTLHSVGRLMDWTLEDNMVDGLFFRTTLTYRR